MKCQILFSRKKIRKCSNCLLKQNSTYNILKYFSYFSQKTKTCFFFFFVFFWDNINLSSPAELAHRVKKVKAH